MNIPRAAAYGVLIGAIALAIGAGLVFTGRGQATDPRVSYRAEHIDAGALMHFTQLLASDALEGRATGTPGNEAARGFILKRFEEIGLQPFAGAGFEHAFTVMPRPERICGAEPAPRTGVNLIAQIPGESPGEGPLLVLTAHYDHLGACDGEIFNGADDNASGTSALLGIATYLQRRPPRHDVIIALLDAEEMGLVGARSLVRMPELDLARVALNMNFDMVGRSEAGELYVAGTYHTPGLVPMVERLAARAPVSLLIGHDRPEDGPDDWTTQSDHAAFHEAGVPFLYFGVEDHAGYHQPTDTFDALTHDFLVRAADTLVMAVIEADASLDMIVGLRAGERTQLLDEEIP